MTKAARTLAVTPERALLTGANRVCADFLVAKIDALLHSRKQRHGRRVSNAEDAMSDCSSSVGSARARARERICTRALSVGSLLVLFILQSGEEMEGTVVTREDLRRKMQNRLKVNKEHNNL